MGVVNLRGLGVAVCCLAVAGCEVPEKQAQSVEQGRASGAGMQGSVAQGGSAQVSAPPMAYAAAPPPPPAARPVPGSAGGFVADMSRATVMPSPRPVPMPAEPAGDRYDTVAMGEVMQVAATPVSTFSADVDTTSYSNVRRFLRDGKLPPAQAVRTEEMVNYFAYDYARPADRAVPFATSVAVVPTPWQTQTRLLHIGIRGFDLPAATRARANVTLLVDVSGSMAGADRLPLLQQAFRLMVGELRDDDTVALVTYANGTNTVLEPTPVAKRDVILAAIDGLRAAGGTAGGDGIQRAYALAARTLDKRAHNRVVLATDGDFNIGITDPNQLRDFVSREKDKGIYLSVLGVGRGNFNEATVSKLAKAGNGNAAYIDTLLEAKKVLSDNLTRTFFTIADDVKFQVEFNPARVAEYRLLGYERRALRREDFNDDKVDAGDVGSGHTVTAIYEIVPAGGSFRFAEPLRYGTAPDAGTDRAGELAHVAIRYKLPGAKESQLIKRPITDRDALASLAAAPAEVQFGIAVAGFAQKLRGDTKVAGWRYAEIGALASAARGPDPVGLRAEFIQLADLTRALSGEKNQ